MSKEKWIVLEMGLHSAAQMHMKPRKFDFGYKIPWIFQIASASLQPMEQVRLHFLLPRLVTVLSQACPQDQQFVCP